MKKEEFETEFYRFVKNTKDTIILGEMKQAIEKRWQKVREERDKRKAQEHDAGIKKRKQGTKVLVLFGELANQTVEIIRHGAKRTTIETESGQKWFYSRRSLVYEPTESDRLTAEANQKLAPVLNKIVGVK